MTDPQRIRRRCLPHWDMPGASYFVTSCLEGSIPAQGLLDVALYHAELQGQPPPKGISEDEWEISQRKRLFARRERWLDLEPAVRHLADPELADIVVKSLYHFAGERYDLLAFVVMPSHIHWVFQPLQAWVDSLGDSAQVRSPRQRIVQSVLRHSSYECNRLRGVTGTFWQHESYDHWVRDVDEMERIMLYIEGNPVKATFCKAPEEWLFSSAHHRKRDGLEFGEPMKPVKTARRDNAD